MPATVIRWENRPVVVTAFYEPFDPGSVLEAYIRAAELSARMGGNVFWVVDLHSADDSFVDIADLWMEIAKGFAGGTVTPALRGAFVGQPAMSDYFNDVSLPFFREINEALVLCDFNFESHSTGV